jgi:transposase InsO family protein
MDLGERAQELKVLLRNRGGQFTEAFDHTFAGAGIEVAKTAPQRRRANAYAERWIRTLRVELTDRLLVLGEGHLRASWPSTCATTTSTALTAASTWYHLARPPRSSTSPSNAEYAANPSSAD